MPLPFTSTLGFVLQIFGFSSCHDSSVALSLISRTAGKERNNLSPGYDSCLGLMVSSACHGL